MSSSVNSEGYLANNVEEIVDNNSDLMNDLQIGRKFNSFQEVQDILSKLKAFNHPMRVFNSQSVEDYNNRLAKAKEPLEPIDGKWKFVYYVIACVHFGQPRKRSNGIRCNQRHLPDVIHRSYRITPVLVIHQYLITFSLLNPL